MAYDAGKFLKTPDLEGFVNFKEEELVLFAKHLNLNFKVSMRNKKQRLTRWSLLLQEYDVIVKHIKGKDNVIADALSRAY